jgi:hypothetical protein
MGAIEDGWLLYYENLETPPSDVIVGKLCVVRTADHRTLIRKVSKGWKAGAWDLATITGEQLRDVVVLWAEPVTFIKPHTLTDAEKLILSVDQ